MKEQLYTIPVTEAFSTDCECPICTMYQTLENDAVEYIMGTSYMVDDIRIETDKIGFCPSHIKMMYANQNRLGLSLMLKTHMDKTISDIEKLSKSSTNGSSGLFKKKSSSPSPLLTYIHNLEQSCFVCNKITQTFERYLVTIFYLYKSEEDFRDLFQKSKGFCTSHYAKLLELAPVHLNEKQCVDFTSTLNRLYLENMKRVRDDLEWFSDKFDYRNVDKPWNQSKDALPRTILKTNSVTI